MKRQIELSLEKARLLFGINPKMDELLLANFTKDELIKPNFPKKWEDITNLSGYYITVGSNISLTRPGNDIEAADKNVFVNTKQATSALAMAQLGQVMEIYNEGWTPDWNSNESKYCICRYYNTIMTREYQSRYAFLAFRTPDIRDEFLENFEDLISMYFMI